MELGRTLRQYVRVQYGGNVAAAAKHMGVGRTWLDRALRGDGLARMNVRYLVQLAATMQVTVDNLLGQEPAK